MNIHEASLRTRVFQGVFLSTFIAVGRVFVYGAHSALAEGAAVLVGAALAGAGGGVIFYASDGWRVRGGIAKSLANIGTLFAYVVLSGGLIFLLLWMEERFFKR